MRNMKKRLKLLHIINKRHWKLTVCIILIGSIVINRDSFVNIVVNIVLITSFIFIEKYIGLMVLTKSKYIKEDKTIAYICFDLENIFMTKRLYLAEKDGKFMIINDGENTSRLSTIDGVSVVNMEKDVMEIECNGKKIAVMRL